MQTLDLRAKSSNRTGPRTIGMPWSLLFIPILFMVAGLSIPYAVVASRIQRRRGRAFCAQMQARGRVIEWSECLRAMEESRGTVIIERYSMKGPVRWWWTSENFYDVCPYAPIESLSWIPQEASYRPFAEWCRQRYTSPDGGGALLVNASEIPAKKKMDALESGTARWINVIPPESLRATGKN